MSVLSLAPPAQKHSKKLEELKTQWEKNAKMGKYLIAQMTDGEAVFKTSKDNNPETQFIRARPTLNKSAEFPMDEENVDKMMAAMEDELIENPKYLQKIIDSATIIALRIIKEFSKEHLDMFENFLSSMNSRRQYNETIYTAETLLRLIPQTGKLLMYKKGKKQIQVYIKFPMFFQIKALTTKCVSYRQLVIAKKSWSNLRPALKLMTQH